MSERKSIEHYAGIIRGRLADIERNAVDQQEKVKKLQAERDQMKAERDGLNRDQTQLAARVDELKAQLANQATVPRVITADELREGQVLAVFENGGNWTAGTVTADLFLKLHHAGLMDVEQETETIVLLEDVPAEEPEPVKVGDTINAEQAGSLPKGAVLLNVGGVAWARGISWWYRTGDSAKYNASEVCIHGPVTVLYLPEEEA